MEDGYTDFEQVARADERGWVLSPGTHEWASLSSRQVQVQALAHSSPRLRHSFLRNVPSYSPTPVLAPPCLPWKSTDPIVQKKHGTASSLATPTDAFASVLSWCLARVSWGSHLSWLCLYFSFNLLLTLSNKSVLTSFPFPYTLTAIHALCSTVGGLFLRSYSFYVPKRLDFRSELVLVAFSFLYAINIAVSNISLHLVTIPVRGLSNT